ncbi:MAG: hypothetical protein ACTS6G_00500 [Candidatus Hodgkinia cicadicola]
MKRILFERLDKPIVKLKVWSKKRPIGDEITITWRFGSLNIQIGTRLRFAKEL